MMTDQISHIDASAGVQLGDDRSQLPVHSQRLVRCVAPKLCGFGGENRLRIGAVNTGTFGSHAHAAVRMHDFPVYGSFWGFAPKTKTRHSQRSKVAT